MPYTVQQRKGHRAELEVKREMESLGYQVIKSGGSKGPFDLVAWNAEEILLIQVKCNGWPGPAEVARMVTAPLPENGKIMAANKRDYKRKAEWRHIR